MEVRRCWNPLVVDAGFEVIGVSDVRPMSVWDVMAGARLTFARPFMCLVNGDFWRRQDWGCIVPRDAVVRFVELPRGGGGSNPLQIIATVAIIAASIFLPPLLGLTGAVAAFASAGIMFGGSLLMSMLFPGAAAKGMQSEVPATMYSLSGGGNRLRLGQPYVEQFGRCKVFPDLAQGSYTTIVDNEQFLYFLGIIGVGEYDVEGVYIDRTLMSSYADATYNILPPGTAPSIVTHVVWTSSEVSGQELDTEFLTFVANPQGTAAWHIEYDVVFDGGLCKFNDKGKKKTMSVEVRALFRVIDDSAQPVGSWRVLDTFTFSAATRDPLRFSRKCPVDVRLGRFEFRIQRTAAPSDDSKILDRVKIGGLRAYGQEHPVIDGVTCLECRVRATDQLSGEVASRINVICTRKLRPVTDEGFGPDLVATRSIVDAVAYIGCDDNGGQLDTAAHWDVLAALRQDWIDNEWNFDWRFTARTGVMSAMATASRLARAVPYLPGGMLALASDELRAVPGLAFGGDDITADTLRVTPSFPTADSPTCVRVSYLNPITWQAETIVCPAGGDETMPREVSLEGCASRQHAWETGMYLYQDMIRSTAVVEFDTGLKGHLVRLFGPVIVGEELIDWGQSGRVAALDGSRIWLSEPVDFQGAAQGRLSLERRDGTLETVLVTPTTDQHCVMGEFEQDVLTLADGPAIATRYVFGPLIVGELRCRVMSIAPAGRGSVSILAQVTDDAVYSDYGNAPAMTVSVSEPAPLADVFLFGSGTAYTVAWVGSARRYLVELIVGSESTVLADRLAASAFNFSTAEPVFSVSVAPYLASGLTGDPITKAWAAPQTPGDVEVTVDATSIAVSWTAVPGATGYDVNVIVDGDEVGGVAVDTTTYTASASDIVAMGGPWDEFEVSVAAIIGTGVGLPAIVEVALSAPAAPAWGYWTVSDILPGMRVYAWGAVAAATGYVLKYGPTGFDPGTEGTVIYSGASTTTEVMAPPSGSVVMVGSTDGWFSAHSALQWREVPLLSDADLVTVGEGANIEPVYTNSGDIIFAE